MFEILSIPGPEKLTPRRLNYNGGLSYDRMSCAMQDRCHRVGFFVIDPHLLLGDLPIVLDPFRMSPTNPHDGSRAMNIAEWTMTNHDSLGQNKNQDAALARIKGYQRSVDNSANRLLRECLRRRVVVGR